MSMAEGSTTPALSRNCRSDCKTCPDLKINDPIKSSVTSRIYELINDTNKRITCKLQNYVYLLTCKSCFVQYVGESVIPLHLRMNIHRKGKSGCEVLINHFNHVCPNSSFFIQILEVLPGTGYINGALDAEMTAHRKSREDFWMKRIRTIYPYGLCDKYKRNPKVPENSPIGKLFPPLSLVMEKYFLVSKLVREMDLEMSMSTQISLTYSRLIFMIYSRTLNRTLVQTPFVNTLISLIKRR